jgi:hypothetical protein
MGIAGGEPWAGFAEAYGHELGLARDVGARVAGLELHWRITDDPRVDVLDRDALARDGSNVDGVIVPARGPFLLTLALHLVAHPDRRLIMVQDIALAARSGVPFELAQELGFAWELHLALAAAKEHAGLEIDLPPRPPRPPLGPLRTALWPGPRPLGVHIGRIAALRGRARLRYVRAGVRSLR